MAGLSRNKHRLPGEIPRLLDEPLTYSDSQSSMSDVDYAHEQVLIKEASDNEHLFKGHLNITLVLNYKAFNYQLQGLSFWTNMIFISVGPV
jgi:hypothetical protein